MLRLTCCFILNAFVLLTAAQVAAQQATSSSELAREGFSLTFMGGCVDTRLDGVWLAVQAESAKAPREVSLEMWFADASASGGAVLRLVHVRPGAVRAAGCIVQDATRLTWFQSDQELDVYSLSHDRFAVLATVDYSEGYIRSVGASDGSLVYVGDAGVGVVSLRTGKTTVHRRFSVAAAYEPETEHLFSVRSVDGELDEHGFPPVALVKERVTGDGILREVARTDPWPMLESIGERQGIPLEADDPEIVAYRLVADRATVMLLRNYIFGTRRLSLRTFDAGTLGVVGDDAIDVEDVAVGFGGLDAVRVGDDVLIGIPKDIDGAMRPGLLRIRTGHDVGEYLDPAHAIDRPPAAVSKITPFALGRSIYVVSIRSTRPDDHWLDEVAIDIFEPTPWVPVSD